MKLQKPLVQLRSSLLRLAGVPNGGPPSARLPRPARRSGIRTLPQPPPGYLPLAGRAADSSATAAGSCYKPCLCRLADSALASQPGTQRQQLHPGPQRRATFIQVRLRGSRRAHNAPRLPPQRARPLSSEVRRSGSSAQVREEKLLRTRGIVPPGPAPLSPAPCISRLRPLPRPAPVLPCEYSE